MEQYGKLLDDYEPEKTTLYSAMSKYFNDPVMTKTKDSDQHSIYMCKTQCMLGNVCRYLVAMVPIDINPIGSQVGLSDINWVCFQTRTLSGNYADVNSCGYVSEKKGPLTATIQRTAIGKNSSTYSCNGFDVTVTLLDAKNSPAYQPKGTLISALETYNTVITLN